MSVLQFKKPAAKVSESVEQHGCGEAFCIACNHTWQAVVPTGTTIFECPSCHTMKGRYRFEFMPKSGDLVRECNCGNQLFYLTTLGHMCANCGTYQEY